MKPYRLVLLGPPASGKGTQGRVMAERWGLPVVSVGEMLRREVAAGSAVGIEAARYLDHGRLVPDALAISSVESWLGRQEQDAFVFDGFPRTVGQAAALYGLLEMRDSPLTAAIWLELPDDAIAERVRRRLTCADCGATFQLGWQIQSADEACPVCGGKLSVRGDDDPAALAVRMTAYRESTEPVMDFYYWHGLLRTINAGGTPEEVFARIEAAVEPSPEPAEEVAIA